MQLRGNDPCGFSSSSAVGVVYQRFGSQTDEKCQQREKKKKLAERKFSLKDELRRVDLKIHGSEEGCVLCQDTNQLSHRTAFCSQPLLWWGSLPSAQKEEEEEVWEEEEEEKVSFYLNICLRTCKECVKKTTFIPPLGLLPAACRLQGRRKRRRRRAPRKASGIGSRCLPQRFD